jgi:hypothetical protein
MAGPSFGDADEGAAVLLPLDVAETLLRLALAHPNPDHQEREAIKVVAWETEQVREALAANRSNNV